MLVCGDYLTPLEIPMISEGGSARAYADTLARLAPLLATADNVIPGHGGPHGRDDAERILEQDATYLESLLREGDAELPDGRRSASQRQIHERNLASLAV